MNFRQNVQRMGRNSSSHLGSRDQVNTVADTVVEFAAGRRAVIMEMAVILCSAGCHTALAVVIESPWFSSCSSNTQH
jgi:hypothetical protein